MRGQGCVSFDEALISTLPWGTRRSEPRGSLQSSPGTVVSSSYRVILSGRNQSRCLIFTAGWRK